MPSVLENFFFQTHKMLILGARGAGMQALAQMCTDLGHHVYLYDDMVLDDIFQKNSFQPTVKKFSQELWNDIDLVLTTVAIPENHFLKLEAEKRNLPVLERMQVLEFLSSYYQVLAFTGTQGKTTATALAVEAFEQSNLDFDYCCGGQLIKTSKSAQARQLAKYRDRGKKGPKPFLLLELDESRPFSKDWNIFTLCLLNINCDHLANFKNESELYVQNLIKISSQSDHAFIQSNLSEIYPKSKKRTLILQDKNPPRKETQSHTYPFCSSSQGVFQSALFIQEVFKKFDWPFCGLEKLLRSFQGVRYRFEKLFSTKNFVFLRDYGHLPHELKNLNQALKHFKPIEKTIIFFQPHKYSRTEKNLKGFIEALSCYDNIYLLPTYEAGETPSQGLCHHQLAAHLQNKNTAVKVLLTMSEIDKTLKEYFFQSLKANALRENSLSPSQILTSSQKQVIVFQGAGSIQLWAHDKKEFLSQLQHHFSNQTLCQ